MSDTPTKSGTEAGRVPPALLLLLIVAAALIAYMPAMRSGFIWDDDKFLTDNPIIHASDGLYRFWFTTEPLDYFPLTSTTLWFEWRLWHWNAAGYHLVNVLLHAASAVLVWRVLARLRIPGQFDHAHGRPEQRRMGGAWLAGLLFALHPVCVESVAWITERKNTLPLPLFLASLLVYLKFEEKAGEKAGTWESEKGSTVAGVRLPTFPPSHLLTYLASLILFLLALLAKTSVVMLPLVLLMCAGWRRGRLSRRDLVRAAPFFALAAALALVTMWYQHYRAIGGDVIRTDDLFGRTAVAGWAVWFYLYKALLPVGLCFVSPSFGLAQGAFAPSHLLTFLPAALLALALLVLWRERRRTWARACLLALGYFIASLLPVLGFVDIYFMKYTLVADHWQYAALIGPIALLAAALCAPGRTFPLRIAVAAGIVVLFGALTGWQGRIYHDSETLWRDTIRKNPDAWIAWNNLSSILVEKGERAARLELDDPEKFYNEALGDADQALVIHPHAEAWGARANALIHLGLLKDAIAASDRAIDMKPELAEAWNIRGNAYARLGDYDRAIADLTRTIELRKDLAAVWFNRGNVRLDAGQVEAAAEDYRQALLRQPNFPAAQSALAAALQRLEGRR